MPAITISNEPSGSVAAKGVPDDFSATLLKHAGFEEINDWHGRRHRLPTTTPQAARVAIASFAAQMLRAARYSVELDPALESSQQPTLSNPRGLHPVGDQVLGIADQIRGAETGADAARAVDQLLDPTNGVLIRLQEALEAATETTNDLSDHDAYELADKFTAASEHLTAACEELTDATAELFGLDGFAPESETSHHAHGTVRSATAVTSAARATSPAASKAAASLGASVPESSGAALPSRVPGPRTR
ncbi:hypothetical protein IQ63_08190 [Streptomyces acidiscabies]|uniref:Uncharacterized protein n=1 Tax=Streptomyces acidiscabies TaxID=42234 RepID=A0A0L0KKG9_9ACTN|nr:hypothetical protein IQ63_08190 [Streptomyces acidiscabies]